MLASIDVRWAALGAGAALAVGAGLGVLVVSVAGDGEPAGSAGTAGTAVREPPVTAVAPTSTEPPSAGEVVAGINVEAGVTASDERWCDALYPAEPCPRPGSEFGYPVSFGIVLENTNDLVVETVLVTYRFLDSSGRAIPSFGSRDPAPALVRRLRPGERFGFGAVLPVERQGVTQIEVEVGEPDRWDTEAAFDADIGEGDTLGALDDVTVTDVSVTRQSPTTLAVGFIPVPGIERQVRSIWAYAIVRDEAGHVIGGGFGEIDAYLGRGPTGITVRDIGLSGRDPIHAEVFLTADQVL